MNCSETPNGCLAAAISEVLGVAGWEQLALDVNAGKTSPQAAVAFALRMPGHFKMELLAAQKLIGKPSLDVRRYVETGERRCI